MREPNELRIVRAVFVAGDAALAVGLAAAWAVGAVSPTAGALGAFGFAALAVLALPWVSILDPLVPDPSPGAEAR